MLKGIKLCLLAATFAFALLGCEKTVDTNVITKMEVFTLSRITLNQIKQSSATLTDINGEGFRVSLKRRCHHQSDIAVGKKYKLRVDYIEKGDTTYRRAIRASERLCI